MNKRMFVVLLSFIVASVLVVALSSIAAEKVTQGSGLTEFYGSRLLHPVVKDELTDESSVLSVTIETSRVNNIVVDVITDKGSTVIIYPLPDYDDLTRVGVPSDTTTISDGGGTNRVTYNNIAAPYAKIVVTKTESGDTTDFFLSIRGAQ